MKKTLLMLAVALLCACSSDDETSQTSNLNLETTEVTIAFTSLEFEPMTRATLTGASMTHLDVWLSDGTTTTAYHQASSDEGFGSLSISLNKNKTYTLYAVAHKATDVATLTDGVISFPEDKVKETFYYTTSFSPATTTSINAEMDRVVGKFTLSTTDEVPDDVTRVQFQMTAATRLAIDGTPSNVTSRTVEFANFSRRNDGTATFTFYLFATDANTDYSITATAYDSDDDIVETKTFTEIPIKNNYKTTLSGAFFVTTNVGINLSAVDWEDETVIDF